MFSFIFSKRRCSVILGRQNETFRDMFKQSFRRFSTTLHARPITLLRF